MLTRRSIIYSGLALTTMAGCRASRAGEAVAGLRLTAPRAVHAAVALPDGSVLFIGGCVRNGCETGPASASVDRYDPTNGGIVEAGRLSGPRTGAAAAALGDGTVLIAGGWGGRALTSLIERFDTAQGASRPVGDMTAAQTCAAIPLGGGRTLIVGESTIEVFDETDNNIHLLTDQSRYSNIGTATLLNSGKVLIIGGGALGSSPRAAAHLFDPETGSFEETGELAAARWKHAAVKLSDGRVLVIGGSDARDRDGKIRMIEVYDPANGAFSIVGETLEARYKIEGSALRLGDGRVLVAGGGSWPEIIDPVTWKSQALREAAFDAAFNFASAVMLANGDVLAAGGYSERSIDVTDRAWLIPSAMLAS